ncbi:hypothetical protein QTP88_024391 [Uroleucon formosanum]
MPHKVYVDDKNNCFHRIIGVGRFSKYLFNKNISKTLSQTNKSYGSYRLLLLLLLLLLISL